MADIEQEFSTGLPLCTLPSGNCHQAPFERSLGLALAARVPQRGIFAHGLCYWNVDAVVRRHGGSTVLGWQVLWWPDRLMVATHHAIWRKPGGALLDITAKDATDIGPDICFCEDSSVAVDLKWPMFVPNKYVVLGDHKIIGRAMRSQEEQLGVARDIANYVRVNKGAFYPGEGLALAAGGSFPQALQRRLKRANRNRRIVLNGCRDLQRSTPVTENGSVLQYLRAA